ncbi:fimbrial protein [Stenotrophomonas sp. LARHCG68]
MQTLFSLSGLSAVVVSLAAGFAQAQTSTTGTIRFTGSIIDVPCEIDSAATSSNVPMGKVFANDFGGVGSVAGATNFKIALKGCGSSTDGATVRFTGVTDTSRPEALQVTAEAGNAAGGVALQLVDDTGTPIDIGSDSKVYVISEGNNTFNFQARYIATAAVVQGGGANAQALFALTYK